MSNIEGRMLIKKLDKKEGMTIQTNEFIDKINELIAWVNVSEPFISYSAPTIKSEVNDADKELEEAIERLLKQPKRTSTDGEVEYEFVPTQLLSWLEDSYHKWKEQRKKGGVKDE